MVALLAVLMLALAIGRVDARGSTRDTILATFNAALITPYPEIEERSTMLIDQIINSDVDIFCLQEVWYADIQKKIYRGVKDYYPYALSAVDLTDNTVSSEPACTLDMLIPVVQCQRNFCSAFANDRARFALCGTIRCLQELSLLPELCLNCLQVLVTGNTSICLDQPASRYLKTYGLMMVSSKELKNPLAQGQTNQSQARGILTASVDGVGDLFCSHLTPDGTALFGNAYFGPPWIFPPLYSSYPEQHNVEVLRALDYATSVDVPIMMGDFNHGPATPGGITWDLPFHYGLMNARGFHSPYVLRDGRCTWCVENAQALIFLPNDYIIDHIYITTNAQDRVKSVERIFDNLFTKSGLRLSDHYGVKMTLSNVRKNCNRFQLCRFFCESEIEELLPLPAPDPGQICGP